ncbi:MAG: hypothetical protein ACI957_003901 [Verrucomicrobiales bacterium]|jgi:hypothetical protein
MMMMRISLLVLWFTSGLIFTGTGQQPAAGGVAAEARGADETSPLGARQQRIKRLLNDLETKFTELATKLEEEQPEQAKKLADAFKQSKEMLLMQRMDQITALLDGAKLETATDEQAAVVGDLKALIDLLLYEESEFERLQREIERLEKWKESLDNLIKDESELQEESEILADPEKAKEQLDAQMKKAQDLIKAQEKLLEETEKKDGSDVDALDKLADEQAELRKETQALAEEMKSKSSEKTESAQQSASEALGKASKEQRDAENELAKGKPKEAGASEKDALKEMKKALKALEEGKERLEKQNPEEAGAELAQKQNETSGETEKLGEEMAEAGESKEGESSLAEGVQNAQQQMNQAAQQLGQSQSGKASESQEKAVEELNKAREEVEKQLNELRDQAQQEQIAKLEEVFKKMLERQRQVTGATREIAERRGELDARLKRADRIELRKWAKEERGLEEDAKTAEALLVDDGTSVVFRDIVGFLQQEIGKVSALMESQQTGRLVQQAHYEIEATLAELVTALENSGAGQGQPQPQPPQDPQQGGGPPPRENLFPPLAELKLLKLTQERINRQTVAMERALAQGPDPGEGQEAVANILKESFENAAKMQDKLTNMTRQVASQLQPTMNQEDTDAID